MFERYRQQYSMGAVLGGLAAAPPAPLPGNQYQLPAPVVPPGAVFGGYPAALPAPAAAAVAMAEINAAQLGAPELLRSVKALLDKLDKCVTVERQRRDTESKMWRAHEEHSQQQIAILQSQLDEDHSQVSELQKLLIDQNRSIAGLIGPVPGLPGAGGI